MIPDKLYRIAKSGTVHLDKELAEKSIADRPDLHIDEYTRAPQKVYVVETLLDHIKDLWELYAIYNNFKQAQEKANIIMNGRVTEWDIEPPKNN